mmetsp:Transcript_29559/g.95439  ORF Transcript_29559/g.95439 Transcript_29559/m.95439 type:complete len:98 (+) Transcript_29559:1535-1828(+)
MSAAATIAMAAIWSRWMSDAAPCRAGVRAFGAGVGDGACAELSGRTATAKASASPLRALPLSPPPTPACCGGGCHVAIDVAQGSVGSKLDLAPLPER